MELLYIMVIGAGLGAIARYTIPGRKLHGALLQPAIGAIAPAVIWEILTWLGMPYDGGWIWVITIVGGAAIAAASGPLLARMRTRSDEEYFAELSA